MYQETGVHANNASLRSGCCFARYQKHGYVTCFIHDITGLKSGNVTVEVTEGRVNTIKVVFMDNSGNTAGVPGHTNEEWILDHARPHIKVQPVACIASCLIVSHVSMHSQNTISADHQVWQANA